MIDLQQTFQQSLDRCMGFATMSLEKPKRKPVSSKYPDLPKTFGDLIRRGDVYSIKTGGTTRDRTWVQCSCKRMSAAYVDDLLSGQTVRCMSCNNKRASIRWNGSAA